MDHLINIDNGGTLTDICVWDGRGFTFTKTLTTPFDLSECLFEGIGKASESLYGIRDLERLLHSSEHIRYSTTQGTNALVERKGPPLGVVTTVDGLEQELAATEEEKTLFDDLVGGRVARVDADGGEEAVARLVQEVNRLTTQGAARIVVVGRSVEEEQAIRGSLLRKFPRHLLGSVPFLYSWELANDRSHARRTWSGIINSFLHPTMERFLYNADARLRDHKVVNPLLVYRNDGASSRVAKAVALKTYSSGPRGGLEGARELAATYRLPHVVMMDVGGTTTDVGTVTDGEIATERYGRVRGVPTSFPISNVDSYGVGGSSIIAVQDGKITVGPTSVGAAPGPACFGFGGTSATITDVNLLLGVLDPDTYLDGKFTLDPERSRAVITETVAEPLGVSLDEALVLMEQAYYRATANAFADLVTEDTTLAAFGGAGPMSACGAAALAGVHQVLVPRMAAVFSAFGISFSDIGKSYEVGLVEAGADSAAALHDEMLERAERDMFQEGYALEQCELVWTVTAENEDGTDRTSRPYVRGEQLSAGAGEHLSLGLQVTAPLSHAQLSPDGAVEPSEAVASGSRAVRTGDGGTEDTAVYVLTDQEAGAGAAGPALVEGPFFSARVPQGWRFTVTSNGDLLLRDR